MNSPEPSSIENKPDYWRYILVFFITFIFLHLFFLYFSHSYKYLYENREYAMWMHVKDIIDTKKNDTKDLLIIGDSRIKAAFNPQYTNINALNLALGGATPVEGYYTLKHYLLNNNRPKNLILSFSPFHLMLQETFWHRAIRFNYLTDGEYEEIKQKAKELNDPVLGKYIKWKYDFLPSIYIESIYNGLLEKRWQLFNTTYKEVSANQGHYFFGKNTGSIDQNQDTLFTNFVPSTLFKHYLQKIIDLAKSKNIPIYWYTAPFNQASCSALKGNYFRNYNSYMSKIENTGMNVLQGITCLDNRAFGDGSHVYQGAKLLTEDIVNTVMNGT